MGDQIVIHIFQVKFHISSILDYITPLSFAFRAFNCICLFIKLFVCRYGTMKNSRHYRALHYGKTIGFLNFVSLLSG
jgi:hypothetical protein